MRKVEPKLDLHLAKKALYRYYEKDIYSAEEKNRIMSYCEDNMTRDNFTKLVMRTMKEKNNNKIIACVLKEASAEERLFLQMKYKLHMTYVAIALKLHVHPQSLQQWKKKFLKEIALLLFFELPRTDVFSIYKLQVLLDVLDDNIAFLQNVYTDKVDSRMLQLLIDRQSRYKTIYVKLKQVLDEEPKSSHDKIIKAKLNNNTSSVKEIAQISGYSAGMVCDRLSAFRSCTTKRQPAEPVNSIARKITATEYFVSAEHASR